MPTEICIVGDDIRPPWNNASSILAKRLAECLSPQVKCVIATVRPEDSTTKRLPFPEIFVKNGFNHAVSAARLALAVRRSPVTLVHLIGTNALVFAPLCRAVRGKKRILRHVFTSYDRYDSVVRPARLLINSLYIDAYAFTTPWIGKWAKERSPGTRRFLLRPPIDCNFYKPTSQERGSVVPRNSNEFSILYMGPLFGSRFPTRSVLGAIKKLTRSGVDVSIAILTSAARTTATEADRVIQLAKELNLEKQVFLKRVDLTEKERVEAYNSSDVVIFPFVGPEPERLADPPFGMLEAMACGGIVLGTEVLSVPEVIQEGITGFLSVSSTVDEIYNGLYRALTSPNKQQVRENARLRVLQDFSYERVRHDVLEAYDSLISAK